MSDDIAAFYSRLWKHTHNKCGGFVDFEKIGTVISNVKCAKCDKRWSSEKLETMSAAQFEITFSRTPRPPPTEAQKLVWICHNGSMYAALVDSSIAHQYHPFIT